MGSAARKMVLRSHNGPQIWQIFLLRSAADLRPANWFCGRIVDRRTAMFCPEIIPVPPAVPAQLEDREAASEDKQLRLERFKKYKPPVFSGLASENALGFLDECYRILRTMAKQNGLTNIKTSVFLLLSFLNLVLSKEGCQEIQDVEELINAKIREVNTKYFHSLIRGRRRKLYTHKIKDENGQWIQGDEAIGKATCDLYHDLFTNPGGVIREVLLSCIPSMITPEDNVILSADPTLQELKEVVFSMNPTSVARPDDFNGKFYQSCWDIIKDDLLNVVLAFFAATICQNT
ncbi:PREDICTED: uncharacterized protein LOC109238686 [Nicotiana attenuata]|uniref:uncharacterized protein LOC109238686 n=1 Tax=Nicotiana attenuata TaxID=49451 RepID=UPI000904F1E9|nr:PREDICTED: uncharacterized protein LOC109238686 [Nicotiana attenuata]